MLLPRQMNTGHKGERDGGGRGAGKDDLGWRVRKGLDRAGPLGHGHAKERGQHSQNSWLNALLIGLFI